VRRLRRDHPTSLPLDYAEANRLRGQHIALKILLGSNTFGPLHAILAPSAPQGRRRQVLDVHSTPGIWIQEMALEHPNGVEFVGVDITPSVLHYPKDNLSFEIYNFPRQGFRSPDGAYDAVHTRCISHQIWDLPNLLVDVRRILRQGGVFLFGEIEFAVFDGNGHPVTAPGINNLYAAFMRAIEVQGIRTNAANEIDGWLANVNGFGSVTHQTHQFPVGGTWLPAGQLKEVGKLMCQNLQRLGVSIKPVLRHAGLSEAQVDALVDAHRQELCNPALRLYGKYHTVWAVSE